MVYSVYTVKHNEHQGEATMKNTTTKQPTPNYYYYSGNKIYFGNEDEGTGQLLKMMEYTSIETIEREVARLNEEGGYVPPMDDDWED